MVDGEKAGVDSRDEEYQLICVICGYLNNRRRLIRETFASIEHKTDECIAAAVAFMCCYCCFWLKLHC